MNNFNKIRKNTSFINNFKECKINVKELVDQVLVYCCEDDSNIDELPFSRVMMSDLQTEIYYDIKENKHSVTYVESHYDFQRPELELDFATTKEMYLDIMREKETLDKIQDYLNNVDSSKYKEDLLKELITGLEDVADKKQFSSKIINTNFFKDDCEEFTSAYDYENGEFLPIGIDYYDTGKKRFNYPESLGMVLMPTGHGKSSLLMIMALASLREGNKTLVIRGEMSLGEVNGRFLPFLTCGKITKDMIVNGESLEYKKLRKSLIEKHGDNLHLVGPKEMCGGMTLPIVKKLIKEIKPKTVIIDYVQQIKGVEDWANPVTKDLKLFCNIFGVNIIVGAQANNNSLWDSIKDGFGDGFPDYRHIEKCKSMPNDCDWFLSGKSKNLHDTNETIFNFMSRKGRQGTKSQKCPYPYIINYDNGVFCRCDKK